MRAGAKVERQRGAALLVVLLLLASVAVVAVATTELMARSVARTGAAQARDRAVWALLGAEQGAALLLSEVASTSVHKETDPWLAAPLTLPLPSGVVRARFEPVACFNVNSVVQAGEGGYASPGLGLQGFADLVEALGGYGPGATVLAEAAGDFIDADDAPGPGGAEDYDYTRRPVPYRTAGRLLADPSELRAVAGWDADTYRALRPYLCALPTVEPASVNVNTLRPEDAPILRALLGNALPMREVERLIERRPASGYDSAGAFMAQPALSTLPPSPGSANLATTSSLVSLTATVQEAGQELTMVTLFYLPSGGTPEVLARRFGAS
ncbi:type II secretion system minor pseudopilin GspK [Parvularcula dongshanensis]|uniref:Type II secretion system protein K n=1 Tax=Parvularcula dongshanensis TaxID=1173995 RepID=A0A840I0B7_9PROT|nr:type II secretion system minor pseudopilin GspK [Parvularcula dongshanensis]MBB4657618.1 general secretion pathway protein K [Parvularcula dongshanensis]